MCNSHIYRIPEEVRDATYGGPTVEPEELSESDKKYIVEFYSDIQGIMCVNRIDYAIP